MADEKLTAVILQAWAEAEEKYVDVPDKWHVYNYVKGKVYWHLRYNERFSMKMSYKIALDEAAFLLCQKEKDV